MRKTGAVLIATVFVLLAATLGWYLPLVVFNFDDTLSERKQMDLDIERINLTYRDDLSLAQKIDIVNYDAFYDDYIELEKGIFNQQDDIKQIVTDFLAGFTGYRFDFADDNYYAAPNLINLSNNRGTIVFWFVSCWAESGWSFTFVIDDKTGAILNCSIYGDPYGLEDLFSDYVTFKDPYEDICEKYRNAIYNHYSKRIDAKFITYHQVQEWGEDDAVGYRMIFRDNRDDTFEITVDISLANGYIHTY